MTAQAKCTCGRQFVRNHGEHWKRLCDSCYQQVPHTHQTRPSCAPPPTVLERQLYDRLPQLIGLAHPDKHGNSAAANDITAWLIELRSRNNLT